jgi:hypothetical protein
MADLASAGSYPLLAKVCRLGAARNAALGAAFGFALGGDRLCSYGLIDFEVGHLELAQKIEEEILFFRSKIALGFFLQGVEHVYEFTRGIGINHRLAGTRVGVGAENHGSVASKHAHEDLKAAVRFRSFGRRRGRLLGRGSFRGLLRTRLTFGFAFLFFDGFLAKLAIGGEGAAVNYAERRFILLVFSQGTVL